MSLPHPIITVEEHWLSQSVRDFYVAKGMQDPYDETSLVATFIPALMDLGALRLHSMNQGGVTLQIVSHVANTIALDALTCNKVNDELFSLMKNSPGRFAGFATLPMADPEAASQELYRCIQELGFVGALIDNNCEGRFYDDQFFWPIFEAAEKLDVPIYLHPSPNEQLRPALYDGNYPTSIGETLSQYAWGWHSETALHFLRLLAAKLFDRYPRLKLVLGHLGEMLPFQLDRIEGVVSRGWSHLGVKLERPLREVWNENIWVTVAGMFYVAPMETVLRQCKPDRIMYSVDHPFGNNEAGLTFLNKLKSDGHINDDLLADIAYRNAEKLFKIKARKD